MLQVLYPGWDEIPGHGARAEAESQESHPGGVADHGLFQPYPRVDEHGELQFGLASYDYKLHFQ